MARLVFGVVLAIFGCSQVLCSLRTYRGAVVEYAPDILKTEEKTVAQNVENYGALMKEAKSKGADIIVFPEAGLRTSLIWSQIPDPNDRIAPWKNLFETSDAVKKLSKYSNDNEIYSVVNLMEKRPCNKAEDENCPLLGFYVFNTNVVFDRSGVVIARYAKFNLFDEFLTNKTKDPEIVFFDTDFGVRFGTFTCFDILFGTPTLRLVQQYGITDFVFTTFWFSELPFLTALQAQRGWAETNNVNLLASGQNVPKTGSAGSGIYNGRFGALVETMPETSTRKLLIADVPIIENGNAYSERLSKREVSKSIIVPNNTEYFKYDSEETKEEFNLLRDQIHLYVSEVIETGKKFEKEICSRNEFCCSFDVRVERLTNKSENYTYRAMVSDAVRKFGESATGGVQSCGVVLCNGPFPGNCTLRATDAPGVFKVERIRIRGDFLKTNSFQMPSTLTYGKKLVPLPANHYVFSKKDKENRRQVSLELVWPATNLNTFAIWGRDFTRDGQPSTLIVSGGPLIKSTPIFLLVSAVSVFFQKF